MRCVSIKQPDDWHVHLRDEQYLFYSSPATAQHFARALVMPNLIPPLVTVGAVNAYRERILAALTPNNSFTPYMTLYLTETLNAEELVLARDEPYILGAKLYPAGATTNSQHGVRKLKKLYPLFEVMQAQDLVLQIHGEVTHGDIFLREAAFLQEDLLPLMQNFPKLRMVLEHISTEAAVNFVREAPANVAATITPHHLLYNRNDLFVGGIRPHYYCLPILKTARDQSALLEAATSGESKFFAGTDSAPHSQARKESACGCAGIYSAPFALAMYAQAFASIDKLTCLNAFMSEFGANFYQLPQSSTYIELYEQPQVIPDSLPFAEDCVIPVAAGSILNWSVVND